MHTLQEFEFWAEGMGYLTAGTLLVAFVLFWLYLTRTPKDRRRKRPRRSDSAAT